MLEVSIPKPCQEDWSKMIPNQQGRHCNACARTVVDFTQMNDEEVKHFLLARSSERICGRFHTDQLDRISIALPTNILEVQLSWWKRFLVASLLAFSTMLFSCEAVITGAPLVGKLANRINTLKIPEPQITMGITVAPVNDTFPGRNCTITKGEIAIQPKNIKVEKMGDVSYTPQDTVKKAQQHVVGKLMIPRTNKN